MNSFAGKQFNQSDENIPGWKAQNNTETVWPLLKNVLFLWLFENVINVKESFYILNSLCGSRPSYLSLLPVSIWHHPLCDRHTNSSGLGIYESYCGIFQLKKAHSALTHALQMLIHFQEAYNLEIFKTQYKRRSKENPLPVLVGCIGSTEGCIILWDYSLFFIPFGELAWHSGT